MIRPWLSLAVPAVPVPSLAVAGRPWRPCAVPVPSLAVPAVPAVPVLSLAVPGVPGLLGASHVWHACACGSARMWECAHVGVRTEPQDRISQNNRVSKSDTPTPVCYTVCKRVNRDTQTDRQPTKENES